MSVRTLDLKECIVLHNHPAANGIVSFGSDDFKLMCDHPSAVYKMVNEKYNYTARVIKDLNDVTYNQAWKWFVEDITETGFDEEQHLIMMSLAKRGYVEYERKAVDGRPD